MTEQRTQVQVRAAPGRDPNQLVGPVLRSDVVALACFGGAAFLFITHAWPLLASLCVLGGLFAGLSPRMEDHFGFVWGNSRIGGKFISPTQPPAQIQPPPIRGQLSTSPQRLPAPGRAPTQGAPHRPEPPPRTGPDAD